MIGRGLERTASLWLDVECAYAWVHSAARLLGNARDEDAGTVRRRFDGLVAAMRRHREQAGMLAPAVDHFAKVRRCVADDSTGLDSVDVLWMPRGKCSRAAVRSASSDTFGQ